MRVHIDDCPCVVSAEYLFLRDDHKLIIYDEYSHHIIYGLNDGYFSIGDDATDQLVNYNNDHDHYYLGYWLSCQNNRYN